MDENEESSEQPLDNNTVRMLVGIISICGTVISSNGWVDFRAAERNEVLLKAQQTKIEHIDALISEIRSIHDLRSEALIEDRKHYDAMLLQLKKACR